MGVDLQVEFGMWVLTCRVLQRPEPRWVLAWLLGRCCEVVPPETSNRAGVVCGVGAEHADIWPVWLMSSVPNCLGTQPRLLHDTQRCWSSLGN